MEFDATFSVGCGKDKDGKVVFQAWMTTAYIGEDPVEELVYSGNKIGFANWFATMVEHADIAENVVTVGLTNFSQ
jgi:hypothetical protein